MTPERIGRGDDERLYQPRIHSRWIRELYQVKAQTGDPITVLVDKALAEFVGRRKAGTNQADAADNHPNRADRRDDPQKG